MTMLSEDELTAYFSDALGTRLQFRVATDELAENCLSVQERALLSEFKHEKKRSSWLRGRAALKKILNEVSSTADTACWPVPNPKCSLSHTESVAVCVGREEGAGIGIDIEGAREVRPAMKKFYLAESEQSQIDCASQEDLLRLWTTKESLFKADMQNANKTVLKYVTKNAADLVGLATNNGADGVLYFKYASKKFGQHWLSVSIAIQE